MKRLLLGWLLLAGTLAELCAQPIQKMSDPFDIPSNFVINRRFYIRFDHGNSVQVEVTDFSDLVKVKHTDSLAQLLLQDLERLPDSLNGRLTAKHIEYVCDAAGHRKLRIRQTGPAGDAYVIGREEDISLLKTMQDTVVITGVISNPMPAVQRINHSAARYYRFTFYLNDYTQVKNFLEITLPPKLDLLEKQVKGHWPVVLGTGAHYLKEDQDKSISADQARGFTNGPGDFISLFVTTNLQNYKSYFAPSFSLGARLTLVNPDKTFKREIGAYWEPYFFFTKNGDNSLQLLRNDFLAISFAQGGIQDHDSRKQFSFHAEGSFGYLIHREGGFVDNNSFRLALGSAQLSKLTVEPAIFFNNFFHGVTPSMRISFRF